IEQVSHGTEQRDHDRHGPRSLSEAAAAPAGVPPSTTLASTPDVFLSRSAVGSTLTTRVEGGTPAGAPAASDTSNHLVGGIGGRWAVSFTDTRRGGRAMVREQLSIRMRQRELNEMPRRWQR